jgi:hypothetical protein
VYKAKTFVNIDLQKLHGLGEPWVGNFLRQSRKKQKFFRTPLKDHSTPTQG